jgi:two-component system sensor histidine kinase ChiS
MKMELPADAKKILVVDDNKIILKAMSLALATKGYCVLTAETGADTLAILRKEKPDLILLDLSFPADSTFISSPFRDGFLILDWARRMYDAEKIPVFVISSTDPEKYKERAQSLGVLTFFQKPVDNAKLTEAIETEFKKPRAS